MRRQEVRQKQRYANDRQQKQTKPKDQISDLITTISQTGISKVTITVLIYISWIRQNILLNKRLIVIHLWIWKVYIIKQFYEYLIKHRTVIYGIYNTGAEQRTTTDLLIEKN